MCLLPLVGAGGCSAQQAGTATAAVAGSPYLEQWLKTHKAEEFKGQVWARVKLIEPQQYRYGLIVDAMLNPYGAPRHAVGTVTALGLQPKPWKDEEDLAKGLAWIVPKDDNDWLNAGQYSAWFALPMGKGATPYAGLLVRPQAETQTGPVVLQVEFATEGSENAIFHVAKEKTEEVVGLRAGDGFVTSALTVRIPGAGGLKGLQTVETFLEGAQRRRALIQALKLGPAPQLNKIKFSTFVFMPGYQNALPSAERADLEMANIADLGINSVTAPGIRDEEFRALVAKHHIIDTTLGSGGGLLGSGWASQWRYTTEAANKEYDYRAGESVPQHWQRVFDDYYRHRAEEFGRLAPSAVSLAQHFNLGDEIPPAIYLGINTPAVQTINETPQLLEYFRQWLKEQGKEPGVAPGWSPQLFGVDRWEAVEPLGERKEIKGAQASPTNILRFYWTQRFINHYDVVFFKSATDAVRKHFPRAKLIAVNYQAALVQTGFLGNNFNLETLNMDVLEIGRQGAFQGAMTEDWVVPSDLGAGYNFFGADLMRAAARKRNLPMMGYIVASGDPPTIRSNAFAWLMQGAQEISLYLYGPIINYGPAFADSAPGLKEVAQFTRETKKFEDQIAAAHLRPAKAAMLIANTSDIMQVHGPYFMPERQHLYLALRHSGVPVDIISEQDILEDDLLQKYSLLVVSDPQVRSAVQRKIAGWVRNGGHLWAEAGAMNWNEYSQPSDTLNPVFGVSRNRMVVQEGAFSMVAAPFATMIGKMNFKPQGKLRTTATNLTKPGEITAWGARVDVTPATGKVLGTYDDNKPAVILNSYGKGEAMLVGALVGEAYAQEHWVNVPKDTNTVVKSLEAGTAERMLATALVDRAGVTRPAEASVPGIFTSVMEAPGATLVFLNNSSGKPLGKVTVRVKGITKSQKVESAKGTPLTHQIANGELTVTTPLENTDILRIRH